MGLFRNNPGANKWIWDSWGWAPRNDWAPTDGNDRQSGWKISGSTIDEDDAYDGGLLFDSPDAAMAYYGARPTPSPGVAQDRNAYSAALTAQGIPESELPFGSGQLRTFLAKVNRGLPVDNYLGAWARDNPGSFNQIANRMMADRPTRLAEILRGYEDKPQDKQKEALINWLLSMYGPTKSSTAA